jgi:transposase InsO family protein
LVIKDYYTKWIELLQINSKTARELIHKFKSVFSRYGIPDQLCSIIISDNMPFKSYEFRAFAKEYGFELTTTSPRYPKSNGMAENGVTLAQLMLKKADYMNGDVYSLL